MEVEAYTGLPDSRLANTGRMITSFFAAASERVGVGIDVVVMLSLLSILVIARVPKFGWNVLWMLLVLIASHEACYRQSSLSVWGGGH